MYVRPAYEIVHCIHQILDDLTMTKKKQNNQIDFLVYLVIMNCPSRVVVVVVVAAIVVVVIVGIIVVWTYPKQASHRGSLIFCSTCLYV